MSNYVHEPGCAAYNSYLSCDCSWAWRRRQKARPGCTCVTFPFSGFSPHHPSCPMAHPVGPPCGCPAHPDLRCCTEVGGSSLTFWGMCDVCRWNLHGPPVTHEEMAAYKLLRQRWILADQLRRLARISEILETAPEIPGHGW